MIFIFKSAITLALLYCCFFAFLSKETFHRFNRIALLSIVLASLTVPFIHITTTHPTIVNETVARIQQEFEPVAASADAPREISFNWSDWVIIGYTIGVMIMLAITAVQIVMLVRILREGLRHTDENGNTVILKAGDSSPFSFWRYIVMSVKDYETAREYILTHEQEHIRLGHSYDILLIEVVKVIQWFNPFIWFLSRDLQAVHEYEADQAVINQGIDAKSYQQLLVTKAVGNRLQLFTNNLRRGSLKQRITMMYKKKSSRWMMLKALCAVPVASLTIAAFAQPSTMERMEQAITMAEKKIVSKVKATVSQEQPTAAAVVKEKEKETVKAKTPKQKEPEPVVNASPEPEGKVFDVCEVMPEYKGGMQALGKYIAQNVQYPKAATETGVQGMVLVQFVIDKYGNVTSPNVISTRVNNPKADKPSSSAETAAHSDTEKDQYEEAKKTLETEAVRVINSMPAWIPGKQNGKNVNTKYTLPITFRIN